MTKLQTSFYLSLVLFLLSCTTTENNNKTSTEKGIVEKPYVCPPCNNACDDLEFEKAGTCPHCNMELILKKDLKPMDQDKRKSIAFYLQSGVEVLDFAGPMEVFAYAGYKVFTVSKTKDPIISQGILKIIPDYSIEDAPEADILAFFGGQGAATSKDKAVIDWVKSQKNVDYHFSVCTGAFILGEAGILDGKTATTFHGSLDDFEKNFKNTKLLKNARYVDNGKVITTAGVSAGIDGALHLVAKLKGFNEARKAAYYMEYDKWKPNEGVLLTDQNPYKGFTDITNLSDYTGRFEFRNGQEVYIKIDERENSLIAQIEERTFPLFYSKENEFLNINNNKVTFIRDNNNQITGYTSERAKGEIFKKIK